MQDTSKRQMAKCLQPQGKLTFKDMGAVFFLDRELLSDQLGA